MLIFLDGDHGYYNNESSMHPMFMAHGPAFKTGYKINAFRNVDIYPLMCHVLGVEPAPGHNGSLDNVIDMLNLTRVRNVSRRTSEFNRFD